LYYSEEATGHEDVSQLPPQKLHDCILELETLAEDDEKWPSRAKQTRMSLAVDAIKGAEGDMKGQIETCLYHLSELIKGWGNYLQTGNDNIRKSGENVATLETLKIDVSELDDVQQLIPMPEGNESKGILGKIFQQDPHTLKVRALKKEKVELVAHIKDLQRLVSSQQELENIDRTRDFITNEITNLKDRLHHQEESEKLILNDISTQTKKLSTIDDGRWEKAWKNRKSALEEKIRNLEKQLKKDEEKEVENDQRWSERLRIAKVDPKTMQTKKQNRIDGIKVIDKRLEEGNLRKAGMKKKIMKEQKVVNSINPQIEKATATVKQLRHDIEQIKGSNSFEDKHFHIDHTKDARGHTFLQVSAQNNDLDTAKLCLELGANPNIMNEDRLMAVDYSFFWKFENITTLITSHGGSLPSSQVEALNRLKTASQVHSETSTDWHDTLKVAEAATLPAETLLECPEACESDESLRMPEVSGDRSYTCFEDCLTGSHINMDQVQRVVLLSGEVQKWLFNSNTAIASNFVNLIEGLKPVAARRPDIQQTKVHRRAIVGTAVTFEVLASSLDCGKVILFSPFVSGEVDGVTQIGILTWAVCDDHQASMYKTLIANTEFMRHKVAVEDRFLPSRSGVLKLGRDMHLLDLQSTSIWTTSTLDLYVVNIDEGDLDRILRLDRTFSPKRSECMLAVLCLCFSLSLGSHNIHYFVGSYHIGIVYSEELVNRAIFRASEEQARENESTLATDRRNMSTVISGGAGSEFQAKFNECVCILT